ncbi:MAG: cytochrome-c oxidase, cbb3-type subunit III [Steroidobacteraceae bacterium]
MSSLMSSPAALFVVVGTIVNILACLWLIWWTAKRRSGEADTTGHTWDGIQEYNNPMPRWWLILFIVTIIFGFIYLALYPGLGNYSGSKAWTSANQLAQEQARTQASFEARYGEIAKQDLASLSKNAEAMASAKNLFANNCTVCHGADARGTKGFPNLTDNDWLWGGSPETILETISNGRKGVMPAWGAVLGKQGVEEVSAYVLSLSGRKVPSEWVAAGKERFATICAACHGPDATGMQALGAPNLTDKTWIYGSSVETIRETVTNGRSNEMPAHLGLLGETKVRMLAAYVYSLSHQQ